MATKVKSSAKGGTPSGGLLHKSFQPGKDGYTYLYHWLKFVTQPPASAKGKIATKMRGGDTTVATVHHNLASRARGADTTVAVVFHDKVGGTGKPPADFVVLDLKQPKSARAPGQFVAHQLPPGTSRKQAEAWIKSREGKAWAAGEPTALAALAVRMF